LDTYEVCKELAAAGVWKTDEELVEEVWGGAGRGGEGATPRR
jgi:hypothetical protein